MPRFFDALESALANPAPMAAFSLRDLPCSAAALESDVVTAIGTSEASFIARSVRDWALRGEFKDSGAADLASRIVAGDLTEEMLRVMVHIIERRFSIGVFVHAIDHAVRPDTRHEVCVRLGWDVQSCEFEALPIDGTGHTCGTPVECTQ